MSSCLYVSPTRQARKGKGPRQEGLSCFRWYDKNSCSYLFRAIFGGHSIEPLDSGLPAGLLASPSLIWMDMGTAYIPVINVSFSEVLLYPRTIVGKLE